VMHYKKMSKEQAKQFIDEIDKLPDAAFDVLLAQWRAYQVDGYDAGYDELRQSVIDTFKNSIEISDYEADLKVGLCLYDHLRTDSGFTNIIANDDDVWRYLSCIVFPDITNKRYPPTKVDIADGHRLNTKRFYLHTRRIWLKTLWWYIHLSWQGTDSETYDVLRKFGSDTISDLYERPGKGYRLALYRELMRQYSGIENKSTSLFNEIQKRNLVNCRTVEPALTEGAERGYISRLLDELSI